MTMIILNIIIITEYMQRPHINQKIRIKISAWKWLDKNYNNYWIHLEAFKIFDEKILLEDTLSSGPRCDAAVDRAKLLT